MRYTHRISSILVLLSFSRCTRCIINSSSSFDNNVNNSISTCKSLIVTNSLEARFCIDNSWSITAIVKSDRRVQNRAPELPALPLHQLMLICKSYFVYACTMYRAQNTRHPQGIASFDQPNTQVAPTPEIIDASQPSIATNYQVDSMDIIIIEKYRRLLKFFCRYKYLIK